MHENAENACRHIIFKYSPATHSTFGTRESQLSAKSLHEYQKHFTRPAKKEKDTLAAAKYK